MKVRNLGVNYAGRAIKFIIENDIFDREIYNIVSLNNTVKDIVDYIHNLNEKNTIQLLAKL